MNVHELLRRHGLRPRKRLGQHFLTSEVHLQRIAAVANLDAHDTVLEIGPGLGSLTRYLAPEAGQVVAVELDEQLLPILQELLADYDNVIIVQGDILKLDPADVLALPPQRGGYKVVANLPYYITSAVIRHLLEAQPPPELMVLTVQKEVGERMCAEPPNMSLLAVSVQFYAQPELVSRIPAGAFHPRPKVDSAVVRLFVRPRPAVEVDDVEAFFRVVRAGFGQRRKQLHNALGNGLHLASDRVNGALERAGIDPRRRAETLTLEEWGGVYREVKAYDQPAATRKR